MGKACLPKGSWRESEKLKTAAATELKGRKGKGDRRGFKFLKTVNKGKAKSATLQLHNWWCFGGKGESPGTEWGPGGSQAT